MEQKLPGTTAPPKHRMRVDLGTDSIPRLLYKLGLPATVGMLVNALYNVVDTIFLGQGVGSLAISALTVALPIQTMILGVGMMAGIGAASLISRSLGEGKAEQADAVAGNAFLSIFLLGTLMMLAGQLFMDPILRLFGASPTVLPYAREYMRIIMLGWLWFPLVITGNNIARSEGAARAAMFTMVIGTGLNIVLDPIFIFLLDMGIAGAAWATIISQMASLLFLLRYYLRGGSMIRLGLRYLVPQKNILREIYGVGASVFASQLSASLVGIVMNQSLVLYGGDLALAAFGVVYRVHMFIFMPLFGTVQAFQPIAGYNYGARNYERLKESVRDSLIVLTLIASAGTLVLQLFPGAVMRVFTPEADLIALGSQALRIMSILVPIIGVQVLGGVLYQAIGKPGPAMFLALLRQVILTLPLVVILPRVWGLAGVFLVFPVADLLSVVITGWMINRELSVLRRELAA